MSDFRISRIIGRVSAVPHPGYYTLDQVRRLPGCKLRHRAQKEGELAVVREAGVCRRAWVDDEGEVWAELEVETADDRLAVAAEAVAVKIDGELIRP